MLKKSLSFSNLTLLVALSLSSVAAYYSIIGLTAIFAGAVIPVIIMGSILEVGKITTTVWLRKYWSRASWALKLYLVPAVVALALLTSMGIFGFLSKAHMGQGITSGDAQGKVAIYDEKIKTAKDNIDANRKALKQLDEAVDQVMGRSTSEQGADKAVAIRRSQANDRKRLLAEIQAEQATVSKLSEERAPLASELRKVEAEVGPIKYIAALIYGDNADQNMLESAVRWVIILLVIVFDPLAIALVLAANASKEWDNELPEPDPKPNYEPDDAPLTDEQVEQLKASVDILNKGVTNSTATDNVPVSDAELEPCYKCGTPLIDAPGIGPFCPNKECDVLDNTNGAEPIDITYVPPAPIVNTVEFEGVKDPVTEEWVQTGPVFEQPVSTSSSYKEVGDGYVEFEGKKMSKRVLQTMRPDLFNLKEDNPREINIDFGDTLPNTANMGDTFIRVDTVPHRVYKNNGTKWMEVDKESTGAYLGNTKYLQSLMEKIANGEYDPDLLTDYEQEAIASYIKTI